MFLMVEMVEMAIESMSTKGKWAEIAVGLISLGFSGPEIA